MSHKDIRLNLLLQIFIDGIPLDLASKLLPLLLDLTNPSSNIGWGNNERF